MKPAFEQPGFAGVLREAARGTDWATKQGTLSRVVGGMAQHVYEFADVLRFRTKPVAWDSIFWRIMGFDVKTSPAPTRHFWGGNCPSATLEVQRVASTDRVCAATDALSFAENAAVRWTEAEARQYANRARHAPDDASDFVMTEVVIALEAGHDDRARQICDDVISGRRRARFIVHNATQSFFEATIAALDRGERLT